MNNYLLTYDANAAGYMQTQLVAFVKENRNIAQWSHPYPGLFLLKSSCDLMSMSTTFQSFFGNTISHVVVGVEPPKTHGILPSAVWEWLNGTEQPSLASLLAQYNNNHTKES